MKQYIKKYSMNRPLSIWQYLFRTPHHLGWVDVQGVKTRYLEAGQKDAPIVIFLHGTAGSLENFCANYSAYAQHFRVIGVDLLGCGLTDKPDHDYLIKDYVEHIRNFLDAMDIRATSVVGVSLGSWIGAAFAWAHPTRVKKLVMVAPAGIITDLDEERKFAEGVRQRRTAAAVAPTWETVAAAMKGLVLDPESLSDELISIRLEIYQDARMKAAMPHLLAFTLGGQALTENQWRSLRLPIQVIAAVDAPNMFLNNAHAIANTAQRVELVEIRHCDHWAQYEQPDNFNRISIEFLQAV